MYGDWTAFCALCEFTSSHSFVILSRAPSHTHRHIHWHTHAFVCTCTKTCCVCTHSTQLAQRFHSLWKLLDHGSNAQKKVQGEFTPAQFVSSKSPVCLWRCEFAMEAWWPALRFLVHRTSCNLPHWFFMQRHHRLEECKVQCDAKLRVAECCRPKSAESWEEVLSVQTSEHV